MISSIIFDWKRTLYEPDQRALIDGAVELLDLIKSKNIPMVLIGKGGESMHQEVERLGVGKYFRQVVFAEGEKDPQVFTSFISKDDPKRTVLIGDRVRSELEIGNKLGAITIWIKQGKFGTELPQNRHQQPDYVVISLAECCSLLKTLVS